MKTKFMAVSKIFISGIVIGLLTGIAIMYLLNGILGHAGMKEAVLAFVTFAGVALYAVSKIFKRIWSIWNISVGYPIDPRATLKTEI